MTSGRIATLLALVMLAASTATQARDERLRFSIAEALDTPAARERLLEVPLYWGDQEHPAVARRLGTFTANRKTNAFNKSDLEACQWAFLSAVLSLQQRALREGGNAVVNIRSVYRGVPLRSRTEFECGAGKIMAGVALEGTVVQLAE